MFSFVDMRLSYRPVKYSSFAVPHTSGQAFTKRLKSRSCSISKFQPWISFNSIATAFKNLNVGKTWNYSAVPKQLRSLCEI